MKKIKPENKFLIIWAVISAVVLILLVVTAIKHV